ncbi:MAG: hypothetical protein ACTHJ0_16270 [Flavipsychrobacter sp.]
MIQTNTNTQKTAPVFRCRENYQFFKAVYYNFRHYLCDFSASKTTEKDSYIVDIEISGKGFLNIEMQQKDDAWQMVTATEMVDANLELILSNAIDSHIQQYHA